MPKPSERQRFSPSEEARADGDSGIQDSGDSARSKSRRVTQKQADNFGLLYGRFSAVDWRINLRALLGPYRPKTMAERFQKERGDFSPI